MWVWWRGIEADGVFELDGYGPVQAHIGQALTLDGETGDTQRVTMKGDGPSRSREFLAALAENKQPQKAQLLIKLDDSDWSCALDARSLAISGLRMPVPGGINWEEAIRIRLEQTDRFISMFGTLYTQYLTLRMNSGEWQEFVERVKAYLYSDPGDSENIAG